MVSWFFLLPVLAGAQFGPPAPQAGTADPHPVTNVWNREIAEKVSAIFKQLPPPAVHYDTLPEVEAKRILHSDAAYQELLRDKIENGWFAALVSTGEDQPPFSIQTRFETWRGLVEFLAEQSALVEVWVRTGASGRELRRIPATDLAELKRQRYEPPTVITVTFPEMTTGKPKTYNLEFGFKAAQDISAANQAYQRHRSLMVRAREILGARDSKGLLDARAQWKALQTEVTEKHFPLAEMPAAPKAAQPLFVAFEFEVDDQNNFVKVANIYQDNEIRKRIVGNAQVLELQRVGESSAREVLGFAQRGLTDQLQPLANPILGQDVVELRVKDSLEPNPRKWHVVEFGEPELLKVSALAHFSQLNAYLERHRKARAMKQANLALVAEPIIAALNIGGGVAGLGFPAGESARLLYNVITWTLISEVPTEKQMRELFALMAARDRDPQIKLNPERYLSPLDIQTLKEAGRNLSDQEVQTYLQQMTDEDVRAMLRLARQGMIDARVTTFLNTLTSALKVSGVSDEAGWVRDLFNNAYFSLNGDVNLSTLLLAALGKKGMTSFSGVSLYDLSRGQGPQEAWLQYLVISVDIRAVLNTIVRLTKTTEAKKELEKPFPYSPRLSELAAYEVRIFGFPLLMFYKRGLIKADRDAYEHDYAYGLRGVSLVEHFPTREAMETEIRAGRMFPLGLVRVPSVTGGWKETDLVVYAHRIPNGKYRGKTALIIYGLKAYTEYSDLIARELLRFKQYEKGLQEGAVIEQRAWDEAASPAPSLAYEPVIHVGSNAVQQIYNPLLGGLLELRRHWLRKSWGLPVGETEFSRARQQLSLLGIEPVEGDPLVAIDPYSSSFIYRRQAEGREQTVKVTSIPSLADIDREMRKLEERKQIEQMRQEAAQRKNEGVILLNEASEVGGHLEVGPLLPDEYGGVIGKGVTTGSKAMAEIFDLINRLPVTDRARLQGNHFAATAIELDRLGKGKQKVFLTIEFPLGEVRHDWTNPLTGEWERMVHTNGLWSSSITDRLITDFDYDAAQVEIGSRTYANLGTRQKPLRGVLLEETRTLDRWLRDLSQLELDPYAPTISKLHINYVTGRLTRETYGLFGLPVEIADEQFVTRNRYTPYGVFETATVFENGRDASDFLRPVQTRVLDSIAGRTRFLLNAQLATNAAPHDLSAAGYRTVVERTDLIKGFKTIEIFDNAHLGRKIEERHQDPFDGTKSFSSIVTWDYEDDFHQGQISVRAITLDSFSGARLAEATTTSFDPVTRRLIAREVTYTGLTRTNTWDNRWTSPIAIETERRGTTQENNKGETEIRTITTAKDSGEIISGSYGQYNVASKTWQVTRQFWYRPGVPDHVETNTYSAFGKLISTRVGNSLENRPVYSPEGREQSSQTFQRNAATGRYDILCRQEDDYHWHNGERDARVRIYLTGSLRDEFRITTDAEGRTIGDGVHQWPNLGLKTVRSYDGDSERMLKAEVVQNGEVRATDQVLGVFNRPEGGWLLRIKVTPFWGLGFTNSFILGDPLGRLVASEFENGDRTVVTAWFPDTSIAQTSEVADRNGHRKERFISRINAGSAEGVPYDIVSRFEISPWGEAGWMEDQALVRGTDVPLFCDTGEEHIYFDLSQRYQSPLYAIDPSGHFGRQASISGTVRSNVTAVFMSRIRDPIAVLDSSTPSERVLELTSVNLHGLFYHPFSKRSFDLAGNLIYEAAGKIRSLGARPYSGEVLFAEIERVGSTRKSIYRYQPGWMQREVDPKTSQPVVAFVTRPGSGNNNWRVNDGGWREWATEVLKYKAAKSSIPAAGTNSYLFQRLHSPRFLSNNPHLPLVTNAWTAWSISELNDSGKSLFESEMIANAEGQLSTLVARKFNSHGHPANKIVYHLPRPSDDTWRSVSLAPGANTLKLSTAARLDLSGCDFVGFYLDARSGASASVQVRDFYNRSVLIGKDEHALSFWPAGSAQVQWLPNESMPERGSVAEAPRTMVQEGKVFVISVAELARAGLDVSRLVSLDLTVEKSDADSVKVTPLYRLEPGERRLAPEATLGFHYNSQFHSSRLDLYQRTKTHLTSQETRTGRAGSAILQYEDSSVASLSSRSQPPYYQILGFADNSDPDSPEPLYALAATDGKFLEYYQTVSRGDTQVYTVVNGFETPKMELYRAGVLDDETSPGILAFGHNYYVNVPLAKAGAGAFSAIANLHNRCVASAFALAGDNLVRSVFDGPRAPAEFKELTGGNGTASTHAQHIDQLPTLAEALLATRQVPWDRGKSSFPDLPPLPNRRNALRKLYQLARLRSAKTKLIPTSPGTEVKRFVDTVEEAGIIELAVKLGESELAGELLAFYFEQSQGGVILLHSSYDAETGASLNKQTRYERPSDADITASSQLSVAEAAFCLATTTGDRQTLEFGNKLIQQVLANFRPDPGETPSPRGLKERQTKQIIKTRGTTLWSEGKSFSLASNARAYLLFTRLVEHADSYPFKPAWKEMLGAAAQEQAAWLTNWISPCAQATGIVPKGLSEIQNVPTETTALALERWTSPDEWLTFIEAADRMGVDKTITRGWLDNLARIHGVTVDGVWGLDWAIAVQRPDAISTVLTAKFLRVANLLGHQEAADFARQNLQRLRQGENWPVVVTAAPSDVPLQTGQGFALYPMHSIPGSKGKLRIGTGWPETLGVYAELADPIWPTNRHAATMPELGRNPVGDITQFFWTAAGFYLLILAVALFWWGLSFARSRRRGKITSGGSPGLLVPEEVMQKAEERWAKRVLGLRFPDGAERSRFSNGAVEQNFHMQLRAIYKLALEWRRVANGWSESDPRLTEDGGDEWLNGLDEFAALVGIYSRWVVKAGRKDGLRKANVLEENEDSNHIWSRLVMYFSESHLRLLTLLKDFKANPATAAVLGLNDQIELVLRMMGMRARQTPFDARLAFDVASGGSALDLLIIQLPGMKLTGIVDELEARLDIPREHVVGFIRSYKTFKEREQLFPIHPYVLEAAKMLPHFLLLGLVGLIWYNNRLEILRIYLYFNELLIEMALSWHSLIWAAPLFTGFALSAVAHSLEVYRYRWGTGSVSGPPMTLDAAVTSFFVRPTETATPAMRVGRWWNPLVYQRAGWILRAIGLGLLALALFQLESWSFATFMFVKILLGMTLLMESASLLVPLVLSRFSSWLEDRVRANPRPGRLLGFINQLNLVPTRPASLIWLSIKYHFQPSLPTGGLSSMVQAIAFYLSFAAVFFFVGSYMFKQALDVWFQETYRSGADLSLVLGTFLFWNTMYLLRFGLFVLFAGIASAGALYPFKVALGLGALVCLSLRFVSDGLEQYLDHHVAVVIVVTVLSLALIAFEQELSAWLKAGSPWRRRNARNQERERLALEKLRLEPNRALGVVYMSGDDLSFHKLTADLLMTRLRILRDQLGSGGINLLSKVHSLPDDGSLAQWFESLYELESRQDVTLWHPLQVVVAGDSPRFPQELGLNLRVESAAQREQMLVAWHVRRWLVTMMSTAGHSQDTGINLVDIALCLAGEGLSANTVFYLLQNKYDNNTNNRPSQLSYEKGELGHRNKLARLLMALAPGARAYSVNDWTPFGFKAGGLVGMDLVHEESLKLTNMLVLDRNANVHDLKAVVADLKLALCDPGAVIIIPGRSTTNTLTAIGQGSQLVEEGQRALTRGVMLLGGTGGETLGTGWGNIQAVYYGRVQRALCDANTPKMPLTSPAQRNASFGDRCEGLIGFGPHAIGISEDIWGVTQAAHNALALGYKGKFHRSQALWHKMRETWSHAEWLSAFPRWSGGYLQMMLDPIMQRINDYGPLSVFAKEIRANGGRLFLSAPSALLSILLMPLAIIWDLSPFVQILILLWNLGLVMNQVLTALGLVACLESTGFNRLSALGGTTLVAILAGTTKASPAVALPGLVLGFLAGGFAMGLGRWLYYRGRDLMLFGPQLVIHALGQIIRQSLEFVLSGASANDAKAVNIAFRSWVGPREDRPLERYQNPVNLRTVVWGVGLTSLLLDLFALANLDFLNVLLLLPSLMFSVSTLVGPFLMQPKPGMDMGKAVLLPRLLGWIASFGFYMLVARLIASGGWYESVGVFVCLLCFGRVLVAGLQYFGYPTRLRRIIARLVRQIVDGGLATKEAEQLVRYITYDFGFDLDKTKAALQKTSLAPVSRATVLKIIRDELLPYLRRPMSDLETRASVHERFVSECRRSFVLGLFTFVWFFVVPMPGLLVFTVPGAYRISMSLTSILLVAAMVVGGILAGEGISLALEWWEKHRRHGHGLAGSIESRCHAFRSLARQDGKLTPLQVSHLYAMFTDVQTYFDQRSYAYAWRTLRLIDQALRTASSQGHDVPSS